MRKYTENGCTFFIKGVTPRLLILSGTHGDEFGVIDAVRDVLATHEDELPSFVYIPEVSPSAVYRRTRENEEGIDVNREFLETPKSDEARAVMNVLKDRKFDLSISFHEDHEFTDFYLYDSADAQDSTEIKGIMSDVLASGIGLYTGCDDQHDPCLGNKIENGYFSLSKIADERHKGTFSFWARGNGIVARTIIPEIPMRADSPKKQELVKIILRNLCVSD